MNKALETLLRVNKLKGRSFDEAAVLRGIERKGAYQLDAFPQFNEAISQMASGGPAADALFDDMIRFYTGDEAPLPVPASRKPVISEEIIYDRTFAPDRIQAKQVRGPGGSVRRPQAQEFKDDYMNQVINEMDFSESSIRNDDSMDNLLLAAALGSLLTGAGVKEAADYTTDEERLQQGREQGYIT